MHDWFGRLPEDHPDAVSRRADAEAFAGAHGMRFHPHLDESIPDRRFYLFSVGTGEVVGVGDNVVEGTWDGMAVRAFDFHGAMVGMSIAPLIDVGPEGYRYALSVVMTEVGDDLPYVYIEHKGLWVRIVDDIEHVVHLPLEPLEVLTGREDFDQEFDVRTAFHDQAKAMLGDRLMQAMLDRGRGFAFEVGYGKLLTYEGHLPIAEWPRMLDAAKAFAEVVSSPAPWGLPSRPA